MTAPVRHDATEVEQLRAQVVDLGEALATVTREHAALLRMLGVCGEDLGTRATASAPPYDEAAAVQARRRAFYVVGQDKEARR